VKKLERLRGTLERLLGKRRPPLLAGETSFVELLHLVDDGQPANQLLASHLAQRGEVDVTETLVPPPGVVVRARHEAHRATDGDDEGVHWRRASRDLSEQTPVFIANPHHAMLHQHLVSAFVELANRDDVGGEAWQEVDVRESPVLVVPAVEEHRAGAHDVGDGAISEADGACDAGVEVGEGGAGAGHAVGRACVQDPFRRIRVRLAVERSDRLGLMEMEAGGRLRCRRGVRDGRRCRRLDLTLGYWRRVVGEDRRRMRLSLALLE
jgi:hypothetical protein